MLLLVILTSLFSFLLFLWRKRNFEYWDVKGVPTLPNCNIILGNFTQTLCGRKNISEEFRDVHLEFKRSGHKYGGIYFFNIPMLVITDPTVVKYIVQIDFHHFADRGYHFGGISIDNHIFNLGGEEWKILRKRISPAFSSGKIKAMFPLMEKHVDTVVDVIGNNSDETLSEIIIYEYLKMCGVDVIGHLAFGINVNTLLGDDKLFYEMSTLIFNPTYTTLFKLLLDFRNMMDLIKVTSSRPEVVQFFTKVVEDTVTYRRDNDIKCNDFLQTLLELKRDEETPLSMTHIVAQSFLFFVAGFETSAAIVHFTLYLLGMHPDIQTKLRDQFTSELNIANGVWTYDLLMNCEYLDMIIKESLRMFPPVFNINRNCVKDYQIPNSKTVIQKDTFVIISILGLHYDPENFENPSEFRPERFSKDNVKRIKPFSYLPFGEGPRFCIGKRFSDLLARLEIMKLVMKYDISINQHSKPIRMARITRALILITEDPIIFSLKHLK